MSSLECAAFVPELGHQSVLGREENNGVSVSKSNRDA